MKAFIESFEGQFGKDLYTYTNVKSLSYQQT